MSLKKYHILVIIIICQLSFLNGCLEDTIQQPLNIELESAAVLLLYLESQGDYINSENMPSLMTASEVFNTLNSNLVIDIRTEEEYTTGHIEGAENVMSRDLLNYVDSVDISTFSNIVIVSAAGQSASYFTCLLRLSGYINVYAMKYGMAAWHSDFATIWFIGTRDYPWFEVLDNVIYEKPPMKNLPVISFSNPNADIEEKLKSRIAVLIEDEFLEEFDRMPKLIGNKYSDIDPEASIEFSEVFNNFVSIKNEFEGHAFVCYGPKVLYHPMGYAGSITELPAHPVKSLWYTPYPFPELRSTAFLQAIPNDKIVAIYSFSGHTSAFIAAYLRLLGYNAKSVLYGANNLLHSVLLANDLTTEEAFTTDDIENYPYVTTP